MMRSWVERRQSELISVWEQYLEQYLEETLPANGVTFFPMAYRHGRLILMT